MKQYLFLATHLNSGYIPLGHFLNRNKQIHILESGLTYGSLLDILETINSRPHQTNSMAAIYADTITHNHQVTNKSIYKEAKFIFLIRSAKLSINEMVFEKKFPDHESAFMYYSYRLRRLCEMAREIPSSVLLTAKDLSEGGGSDLVNNYLGLIETLDFNNFKFSEKLVEDNMPFALGKKAEECYERHLFYMKSLTQVSHS